MDFMEDNDLGIKRINVSSREINQKMLEGFLGYFEGGSFINHMKIGYRVIANNVKATIGIGHLLALTPWNIATTGRRLFEESTKLEKMLFTPYSFEDGKKDSKDFCYAKLIEGAEDGKYISGGMAGLMGGSIPAVLQTIAIPLAPFIDKETWWVPATALATNLVSFAYEKRRKIKQELIKNKMFEKVGN